MSCLKNKCMAAAFGLHQLCTCKDRVVHSSSMHMQVLRLQSTSASPNSPPVDHASGIEAMVLAILQQANYSQQMQLEAIAGTVFQTAQDGGGQEGVLLDALAKLLVNAQSPNAMVQARLGGIKSAPSLIPVSHFVCCMHAEMASPAFVKTVPCWYVERSIYHASAAAFSLLSSRIHLQMVKQH